MADHELDQRKAEAHDMETVEHAPLTELDRASAAWDEAVTARTKAEAAEDAAEATLEALLREGTADPATMNYFEEPQVASQVVASSDSHVELVMLLAKNMGRVMDLFRKVRCAVCLCSSAAHLLRLQSPSTVGYQ